ncbi:hypothetical protein J6590_001720, partial [Homalodisca vitripennis]
MINAPLLSLPWPHPSLVWTAKPSDQLVPVCFVNSAPTCFNIPLPHASMQTQNIVLFQKYSLVPPPPSSVRSRYDVFVEHGCKTSKISILPEIFNTPNPLNVLYSLNRPRPFATKIGLEEEQERISDRENKKVVRTLDLLFNGKGRGPSNLHDLHRLKSQQIKIWKHLETSLFSNGRCLRVSTVVSEPEDPNTWHLYEKILNRLTRI